MGLFDRLDDLDRRAGLRLEPVPKEQYQRWAVVGGCLLLVIAAAVFATGNWVVGSALLAGALFSLIERGRIMYFFCDGWLVWPRREKHRDGD